MIEEFMFLNIKEDVWSCILSYVCKREHLLKVEVALFLCLYYRWKNYNKLFCLN